MYLGYIHFFRALAIFFIVAGHAIDAFSWIDGRDIERFLRITFSNGSTLFVFIAGYLFQHLLPKYETKKYLKQKLKVVIIPYLLISIPAIVVFVFFKERETVWDGFYQHTQLEQIFLFILTGKHLAPLWFVPMITLFYLSAPMLRYADQKDIFYKLLPLFVVISCLIGRGLPYQSYIHFFSAYVLGMACSRYKDWLNPLLSQTRIVLVTGLCMVALGCIEFYFMKGTMTYVNHLQKLIMSLFFIGLLFRFNQKLQYGFINLIADVSFGIFFIHSYVLTSGKILYGGVFGGPPIGHAAYYIVVAVSTLLLCTLIVVLIKKAFGSKSRMLVGS